MEYGILVTKIIAVLHYFSSGIHHPIRTTFKINQRVLATTDNDRIAKKLFT